VPFAAILVKCAPSGEIYNYCTPQIRKENFENLLIYRCKYILLCQVYCAWQVVETPTISLNSSVRVRVRVRVRVCACACARARACACARVRVRVRVRVCVCVCARAKNNPTGLERSWDFRELEAARFQDSLHKKMVRLLAISSGRLYLPADIAGTHFCYRLNRPQGHIAPRMVISLKNPAENIGNRTGYILLCLKLLHCSALKIKTFVPPKLNNDIKYKLSWEAKSCPSDQ
jgi:hypothetical protein